MKKYLLEVLQAFLEPIRERRKQLAKDPKQILDLLRKGTEAANDTAHKTLTDVRKAMGIDYFDSTKFG